MDICVCFLENYSDFVFCKVEVNNISAALVEPLFYFYFICKNSSQKKETWSPSFHLVLKLASFFSTYPFVKFVYYSSHEQIET